MHLKVAIGFQPYKESVGIIFVKVFAVSREILLLFRGFCLPFKTGVRAPIADLVIFCFDERKIRKLN